MKIELEGSSGSDIERSTDFPGIHEVSLEDDVVRTYSNGLSFKHVPGTSRRTYQVAFSTRIQELGIESARQCHLHAPKLMSLFARWRMLEERYLSSGALMGNNSSKELKTIADDLNIAHAGMDDEELYNTLSHIMRYRNPKYLAAQFAALCKDRSNLGQSSFLRLVASGRNYLDATEKLWWLQSLFKKEPEEFASFLLFGRAPWTETRLSRRRKSSYFWARNFIVGIHNKFMFSLKTTGVSLPENLLHTEETIIQVIENFIVKIDEKRELMTQEGADTTRITSFLNSLKRIKHTPSRFTDWLQNQDKKFSWRALKLHANMFHGISFSAFRAVLLRACLHQQEWKHAIERCIRLFTPETTLKKPFHDRSTLQPLPIDLVMGQKYVIYRPGNAEKMKKLFLEHGCLWFEVPKVMLNGALLKGRACWHAPKKVLRALENGARIRLFRFKMPQGPGKKLKVDLTLSGPEELFLSSNHLNDPSIDEKIPLNESIPVIGIDVNRLSEHVLTGSRDLEIKRVINGLLNKWISLDGIIKTLQTRSDTTRDWQKVHKLKMELRLLHQRRSRIRNDLVTRARLHLGKKLLEWNVSHVGIEADIRRDTKDKKGPLAWAIAHMPDNLELIARELVVLKMHFQRDIKLVLVRKEGTSRYHHQCGGIIERWGDEGTCKTCGIKINTHENAARNIEERATILITECNNNHDVGGTPFAC